jgi:hypothetical protein
MTPKERAAELKWWCADSIVTIPFADIHERINELVGRPVWTHEIPGLDQLVAEILSQEEATLTDVLGKFSPGKPIVVVDMSDGS